MRREDLHSCACRQMYVVWDARISTPPRRLRVLCTGSLQMVHCAQQRSPCHCSREVLQGWGPCGATLSFTLHSLTMMDARLAIVCVVQPEFRPPEMHSHKHKESSLSPTSKLLITDFLPPPYPPGVKPSRRKAISDYEPHTIQPPLLHHLVLGCSSACTLACKCSTIA